MKLGSGEKVGQVEIISSGIRVLPSIPSCRPFTRPYDRAELMVDAVMHVAGVAFAIVGMIELGAVANRLPDFQKAAVWIYSTGLLVLFSISAIYNIWPVCTVKLILRRFDQGAIYLFIAATYTPFVARIEGRQSFLLLAGIWAGALTGVVLKLAFPMKLERVSVALCLALGWNGLISYDLIFSSLAPVTVCLIVGGGTVYSMGIVFHLWDNLRFQNAIWHAFVILGAGLQFMAVLTSAVLLTAAE